MENCVAPGLDEFDVLLEVVLSLVRVIRSIQVKRLIVNYLKDNNNNNSNNKTLNMLTIKVDCERI